MASKILKFADDTKLWGAVGSLNKVNTLENDLRLLMEWSEECQMLLSVENVMLCMHYGFNNALEIYEMNGKQVFEVSEEKDLGMVIQNDLQWRKQCVKVSSSGNKILGMIRRAFVYKTKEVIVQLNKSLVRPHLE